jgi:hypothetical protein
MADATKKPGLNSPAPEMAVEFFGGYLTEHLGALGVQTDSDDEMALENRVRVCADL